jgi:DNA polymerase-3 subunit epsilon
VREIVLDTETTGLDPFQGHRLIEIACVELINRFPSGQSFHRYVNPERDVPAEAIAVANTPQPPRGPCARRRPAAS